MAPEKPWIRIPEWFYDNDPISQVEVNNDDTLRVYASIQQYLGRAISRRAVNEFLFGDGIKGVYIVDLQSAGSSEIHLKGLSMLEAKVIFPGGNGGAIRHTFNRHENKTVFDYIKPDKSDEKFPQGFGREFFKHYIPTLRDIGIKGIDIQACSNPSVGMNGAYTWCFYGFTNRNMKDTLHSYILYLEDYHGICLDGRQRNAIIEIERMKRLAEQKYAEDFLKGKRRGIMKWSGYIPDIHDENTIEMDELIGYLSGVK